MEEEEEERKFLKKRKLQYTSTTQHSTAQRRGLFCFVLSRLVFVSFHSVLRTVSISHRDLYSYVCKTDKKRTEQNISYLQVSPVFFFANE